MMATTFAQQQTIVEQCGVPSIPNDACIAKNVYLCNVGFDVSDERNMLFFNIASDAACLSKFKSDYITFEDTPNAPTRFFLVEDENQTSPLSLTLAGSLAMAASLNERSVTIVYRKIKEEAYGGTRLLTIEFSSP